jgi:hypothetical protein
VFAELLSLTAGQMMMMTLLMLLLKTASISISAANNRSLLFFGFPLWPPARYACHPCSAAK